jgi:iron complex outermembrane receptor protein
VRVALLLQAAFALPGAALAQAPAAAQLDRVEITGSSIKRSAAAEGGLPVTTLRAEDLRASGVTTVEEAVSRITASQSITTSASAIGSGTGGATYASLRALAPNKTLVLLNGRRLAMFAFQVAGVDLNTIPFSVVERIEILRDGASAIYGTDAIGGVINFITEDDYRGLTLSAELVKPEAAGGDSTRQSVSGGFGDLQADGYNLWASFDRQDRNRVRALDRDFARSGVIPSRGVSGTSPTTFPGNFTQNASGVSANPTAPACAPPYSIVSPTNNRSCVFDFTSTIDIVPEVEIDTWLARGSLRLGEHRLSLEHSGSNNVTVARVAPDPVSGIVIAPDNPFYPRDTPGLNTALPVTAGWRMLPAGPRTNRSEARSSRTVLDVSGTVDEVDYRVGFFATDSRANDGAVDGYVDAGVIRREVGAGRLNPFAEPTAAQLQIIEDAKRRGVFATARGEVRGVDLRASREWFALPGGRAAVAVSAERRHERYRNDTNDDVVNAIPSAGRTPSHARAERDVTALSAELLLPFTRTLEGQLAVRTDDYQGVGRSTNPKVSLRWAPRRDLTLRGSFNTGFRAPTLDEMFGPQRFTFAQTSSNDPLLCPGGVADRSQGGVQARDCGRQVQVQAGGNPVLRPEKSRTLSLGLAVDPVRDLTLSADYWRIEIRNLIAAFPDESIINNPGLYGARIVRCAAVPAAVQDLLDRCQGDSRNSPAIAYLITLTDNIGQVKTDGLDLSAAWQWQAGGWGRVNLTYDATWIHRYRTQNTPDEAFRENVGQYVDQAPVLRWQHAATLAWKRGDWGARLGVRHKSGYRDQNNPSVVVGGPGFYGDVEPYTVWDASVSTRLLKALDLTLGVRNLADRAPPFSNQSNRPQRGYDPRFADPLGRSWFVRASYRFS